MLLHLHQNNSRIRRENPLHKQIIPEGGGPLGISKAMHVSDGHSWIKENQSGNTKLIYVIIFCLITIFKVGYVDKQSTNMVNENEK